MGFVAGAELEQRLCLLEDTLKLPDHQLPVDVDGAGGKQQEEAVGPVEDGMSRSSDRSVYLNGPATITTYLPSQNICLNPLPNSPLSVYVVRSITLGGPVQRR